MVVVLVIAGMMLGAASCCAYGLPWCCCSDYYFAAGSKVQNLLAFEQLRSGTSPPERSEAVQQLTAAVSHRA